MIQQQMTCSRYNANTAPPRRHAKRFQEVFECCQSQKFFSYVPGTLAGVRWLKRGPRHLKGDQFDPYSAGIEIRDIDSRVIRVMAEVGIDISGQRSKNVDTLKDIQFDYVITVCDHAHEACPFFPARTRLLHRGFAEPPKLAETDKEALEHYRRVRDEIRSFVERLEEVLGKNDGTHDH
jgi:arsenate reductase